MLKTAINAARAAAEEIMKIYGQADFGVEMKADSSPLTLADKAAHEVIVSKLQPTGIPILSEEGEQVPYEVRRTWRHVWIVDPLDGTKEFIKRNDEFTVNIALVEYGMPVLGVIEVPAMRKTYFGSMEGAYIDYHEGFMTRIVPMSMWDDTTQQRLIFCPFRKTRPFTVAVSRSHLNEETEQYIDSLRAEHPDLECISAGSSLKMCMVAEDRADVYPRLAPTMEWDTAAGDAIARAAGCKVVDAHTGELLLYNKPDLHCPHFIVKR